MKTTERRTNRATWFSLAVAAPVAALTFMGSVAWAASAPVGNTTTAAAVVMDVVPASPATAATAAKSSTSATTVNASLRSAPKTHTSTGASGR